MRKNHRVVTTARDIDTALKRARRFAGYDPRAKRATYDARADRIVLQLDTGVEVAIPRRSLQGLDVAAPRQVARIQIVGRGTGLHWPLLDVDHYVLGLLNQVFGTKQWMAHLGRLGGTSRSAAKRAASRANGRKGGRPARRRVA